MEYRELGNTGYRVSRLCMGTLTMGPLQLGLSVREGARLLGRALDEGINFFDTAHLYRTYPYIRAAIGRARHDVVIASRSYAYTASDMRDQVEEALRATGRDRIELFGLHEQESGLTLKGHHEALEYLVRAKQSGKIGAILVSTHHVEMVRDVLDFPEVDVIHPLFNMRGIGIRGGTAADMQAAIDRARHAGRGVYAMKALAGGHLLRQASDALAYVKQLQSVDSVAVGMGTEEEIEYNAALFSDKEPGEMTRSRLLTHQRSVRVEEWCTGCGRCKEACPAGAISVNGGRACVDTNKCVFCGYCVGACEGFFIKVV